METIRGFHREQGRPPTTADWRVACPLHPDPGTVSRHFGSWAAALEAAGFTPRRIEWTDEQLLDAIRGWSAEHGSPSTTTARCTGVRETDCA